MKFYKAKTSTTADVDVHYIKKPAAAEWTYISVE